MRHDSRDDRVLDRVTWRQRIYFGTGFVKKILTVSKFMVGAGNEKAFHTEHSNIILVAKNHWSLNCATVKILLLRLFLNHLLRKQRGSETQTINAKAMGISCYSSSPSYLILLIYCLLCKKKVKGIQAENWNFMFWRQISGCWKAWNKHRTFLSVSFIVVFSSRTSMAQLRTLYRNHLQGFHTMPLCLP